MPFDIAIISIKREQSLSFTSNELASFAAPKSVPEGPGILGITALAEDHCGIQSASGVFRMKRVWTKRNPEEGLLELFEGFVSSNVTYSGLYKRKGHGSGANDEFAFCGVRARTGDTGKKVGLNPTDPPPINGE